MADQTPLVDEERVALAAVARPHGVRGELRLKLFNPSSEVLQSKPRVYLVPRVGEARWVRLVSVREMPGTLLVRLDGVRDYEAADALRGAQLEVLRSILPEPEEDEYYIADLEGCEAYFGDELMGIVKSVLEYPTCDVLVIDGPRGRLEFPLQPAYVDKVDVAAKRITLSTAEGI